MRSQSKSEHRVVSAGEVQLVGALKAARIVVARNVHQRCYRAAFQLHAVDLHVFAHNALEHRQGGA